MGLSDLKLLGSWDATPGAVYRVRFINNKYYGTQDAPELGNGSFLIRDRKFFKNMGISGFFTVASTITSDDLNLLETDVTEGADNYGATLSAKTNLVGYLKQQSGINYYFQASADLAADKDGDGLPDSTTARSANVFNQAWDWIKANPMLSAGIALAVFLLWKSSQGKGKKKGFLAGLL